MGSQTPNILWWFIMIKPKSNVNTLMRSKSIFLHPYVWFFLIQWQKPLFFCFLFTRSSVWKINVKPLPCWQIWFITFLIFPIYVLDPGVIIWWQNPNINSIGLGGFNLGVNKTKWWGRICNYCDLLLLKRTSCWN